MARPPSPPWHLPALLAAGLPSDGPAWVARVAAALEGAPTIREAADGLGVPLRTLQRALERLRAEYPELAAGVPSPRVGGWREGHAGRRPRATRAAATTG